MNAGAILEFDATANPTANYVFKWGTSGTNNNVVIDITGTAGARCRIRSNVGGGNAAIDCTPGRHSTTIRYCDFTRIGTASAPAIEPSEFKFDMENCVFDGGGKIVIFQEGATTTHRYVNVTMKNTLATACISAGSGHAAITTGTRLISGCVFDKLCSWHWRDYTITNTIFQGSLTGTTAPLGGSGTHPGWASFTNNLVTWNAGSSDANITGSVTNCYCLSNYAVANPHYLQLSSTLTAATVTVSGCVFEDAFSRTDGDCVMAGTPSVAQTLIVEHNLGLPNASRTGPPGTCVTAHGNANSTIRMRHNTWFLGTACTVIGEAYAGHAGQLAEFRDNLCYDDSVHATGWKLHDSISSVMDHATVAGIHHNAGYFYATGSNGGGYNALDFSSGTPGANDVDGVDPDFVDDTRNMKTWDASIAGGAGSHAHAIAELVKINEPGYNPAYTIAALVTWVKAGFVPRAAALQAASDSVAPSTGWIGALAGTTATATVDHSRLLLLGVGARVCRSPSRRSARSGRTNSRSPPRRGAGMGRAGACS